MLILDGEFVRAHLTYDRCIPLMQAAMTAFSRGDTLQTLRSIIPLAEGRAFGVMPGALSADGVFGAKLVSVFPGNADAGRQSHQGFIALFDPSTGALAALVNAGEVTRIRTASVSAAATDALARPDARSLAILGGGEQAEAHLCALLKIRPFDDIRVWARSSARADAFARDMSERLGVAVHASPDVRSAVLGADVICTVTASPTPILQGAWVSAGAHVNVVGSSYAGPVEVDSDLVRRSLFFVDSRPGVLQQGAEFIAARDAGLIDDSHLRGEIGEVFSGDLAGRTDSNDVTVYKSLGHVVQDLASARFLAETAHAEGLGVRIDF